MENLEDIVFNFGNSLATTSDETIDVREYLKNTEQYKAYKAGELDACEALIRATKACEKSEIEGGWANDEDRLKLSINVYIAEGIKQRIAEADLDLREAPNLTCDVNECYKNGTKALDEKIYSDDIYRIAHECLVDETEYSFHNQTNYEFEKNFHGTGNSAFDIPFSNIDILLVSNAAEKIAQEFEEEWFKDKAYLNYIKMKFPKNENGIIDETLSENSSLESELLSGVSENRQEQSNTQHYRGQSIGD